MPVNQSPFDWGDGTQIEWEAGDTIEWGPEWIEGGGRGMTRQADLVKTECEYAVVDVGDDSTTVVTGAVLLYGVYVNTVLSAHVLPIKDDAVTVISIAASAAAGTNTTLPGIRFNTSLIVDPNDAATGSITLAYRRVDENEL